MLWEISTDQQNSQQNRKNKTSENFGKSKTVINLKASPLVLGRKIVIIDGNQIPYSDYGKVLGVKIGTTDYNKHIQDQPEKENKR